MKSKRVSGIIAVAALCLLVMSCATNRRLQSDGSSSDSHYALKDKAKSMKTDFLRKVYDNEVFATGISSKLKFTIDTGSKNFSVSGSLKMKKDEVICLRLTPLDLMEAGRLEFTPDYVLLMDRINKEYVKVRYDEVGFLKRNGLDFYVLQALFWNRLFVPGIQKTTNSSLENFDVTFDETLSNTIISLLNGDMSYKWAADKTTGQIKELGVTYNGNAHDKTSVVCSYGAFKPFNRKQFPSSIALSIKSGAMKTGKTTNVKLQLNNLDTDKSRDTYTVVPDRYKRVGVEDVVNRILKM